VAEDKSLPMLCARETDRWRVRFVGGDRTGEDRVDAAVFGAGVRDLDLVINPGVVDRSLPPRVFFTIGMSSDPDGSFSSPFKAGVVDLFFTPGVFLPIGTC
jgi:hypothetical protein